MEEILLGLIIVVSVIFVIVLCWGLFTAYARPWALYQFLTVGKRYNMVSGRPYDFKDRLDEKFRYCVITILMLGPPLLILALVLFATKGNTVISMVVFMAGCFIPSLIYRGIKARVQADTLLAEKQIAEAVDQATATNTLDELKDLFDGNNKALFGDGEFSSTRKFNMEYLNKLVPCKYSLSSLLRDGLHSIEQKKSS